MKDTAQAGAWMEPPRLRADLGRPSGYGPEMVRRILLRLCDGVPLARLCLDPGMPDRETVRRWRLAHPDFDAAFRQAQRIGWECLAENVIEDVDAALAAGASVRRARLMFDARRWLLARQAPEFFGSGRTKKRREARKPPRNHGATE